MTILKWVDFQELDREDSGHQKRVARGVMQEVLVKTFVVVFCERDEVRAAGYVFNGIGIACNLLFTARIELLNFDER